MSLSREKRVGSTPPTPKSIVGTIRLRSGDSKTNGPLSASPKSLREKLDSAVQKNARTIFLTQSELNSCPWLNRLPNGELFYRNIPIKLGRPGYLLPNSGIVGFDDVVYADGYSYEVKHG